MAPCALDRGLLGGVHCAGMGAVMKLPIGKETYTLTRSTFAKAGQRVRIIEYPTDPNAGDYVVKAVNNREGARIWCCWGRELAL